MNEKLNIQNLTDELSENYGINRKEAEAFVKNFFSVIEEGLEKDKYVKIKGFGTFKLIDVDSRESINVNTGERFEIQGHSKVTFTPDNNIKEAVNKPFSAFQTVVLADGVTIEAPEENLADDLSDEMPDEEIVDEAKPFEEETDQLTQLTPNNEEEPVVKEELAAEEPVQEESMIEEALQEEAPVSEEPIVEESPKEEPSDEEVAPIKILPIFDDEAIKKKEQPVSHQQEVMALKLSEEKRKEISRKAESSATPYLMFLSVLIIMLCLGIVAYIYYPDLARIDEERKIESSSQFNTLRQADVTPVVDDQGQIATNQDSIATVPAAETKMQQPTATPAKEVTMPITVREESVPPASKKTETPASSAAKQAAQSFVNQPAASTTSPANNLKTGVDYKIDGEICVHELKKGETLFALSRKYYGPNALYVYIVEYNKDIIKDPDNVPVGTKLRIPKLVKK